MSRVHNPYDTQPCNPFDVTLPSCLEEQLTGRKLTRVNEIRLEHARIVAQSLAKAYGEIMAIVAEPDID
jgi:hypothetical protein